MRIFVYEYITGGGMWYSARAVDNKRLLAEGRAMARAITADLAALPEIHVQTTRDVRLAEFHPAGCRVFPIASAGEEAQTFWRLATESDWSLLIAPETDAILLDRCRLAEAAGGRLLSPSSVVVELTADKQRTAEFLTSCGVPAARGICLTAPSPLPIDFLFPAVLKPIDGCGSQGIRLIRDRDQLPPLAGATKWRLEEYVTGWPASVAVLCGSAEKRPLPACQQRLSRDGHFSYLGGRLPLPPPLDARTRRLALAAAQALPQPRGYIGVDLVLGLATDGSGDRVIEVNPRLTTSYVGLRAAAGTNLAAAMLAIAAGKPADLRFGSEAVEFTADGTVCVQHEMAGTGHRRSQYQNG